MERRQREHWQHNLRLTSLLLAVWFVVTFGVIWFARELNAISVAGFPLAFYMSAQGSLLVYLIIIWFYARRMDQLDQEFGVDEREE